jgi:hypothetical protein
MIILTLRLILKLLMNSLQVNRNKMENLPLQLPKYINNQNSQMK